MANLIPTLQELQSLPGGTHLFCDDDGENPQTPKTIAYPERLDKFFEVLQLLAYDGAECEPYQKWIYDEMDGAMTGCAKCIRNYYVKKKPWRIALLQDFDEPEVEQFMQIISRRELARIKAGLEEAKKRLENTPESNRTAKALTVKELLSLFEALHCKDFYKDEELLQEYFDKPFKLVQTKRPLKVTDILPAVTDFLFSSAPHRLDWAVATWKRLQRTPTDDEWDWSIKDTIVQRLEQIQNDKQLARFWSALAIVAGKLDAEQTGIKLFDFGFNFARFCLDHIARGTDAFPQIVKVLTQTFQLASDAFWQGLVSVSAVTVAEQIISNKHFDVYVKKQAEASDTDEADLDVLAWMEPFLKGLQPANRPAAANTLTHHLLKRVKSEDMPQSVQNLCFGRLVKVLSAAVMTFSDNQELRATTAKPVLADTLEGVSNYLSDILSIYRRYHRENEKLQTDVIGLVRNVLNLECQCLNSDYDALSRSEGAPRSFVTPKLWSAIIDNLDMDDSRLSAAVLKGTQPMVGLGAFRISSTSTRAGDMETFNRVFAKVEKSIATIIGKLAEYPADRLDPLFANQDSSMGIIGLLFSGDEETYQAAVELIKNVSGDSGRKEALTHLMNAFFGTTLYSVCWVFRRSARMGAFAPIPRLLKTARDFLGILCDSTGLLRAENIDRQNVGAAQSFWTYSWIILGRIFSSMEVWSIQEHNKPLMTDVCRDTMQYAKDLFSHYYLFLSVLQSTKRPEDAQAILLNTDASSNSGSPPKALEAMTKWLRLKDDYLAETLVGLIISLFKRLKEYGIVLDENKPAVAFTMSVAGVAKDSKPVKTALTQNQKAELVRSLEQYLGRSLATQPKIKKQQRLDSWTDPNAIRSAASIPRSEDVITIDEDDFGDQDLDDDDLSAVSDPSVARQKPKPLAGDNKQKPQVPKPKPVAAPSISLQQKQALQAQKNREFIQKRKADEAARKARDKELAAKLRGQISSEQTASAGSGLAALGSGRDPTTTASSLMVSDASDSDSSDEDDELFGTKTTSVRNGVTKTYKSAVQGPIRKIKQVRSAKDMRARLAPDLTSLHKLILGWDFFAESETPPNSTKEDYTLVTNTFKTVQEYQRTFEPLLILEGWQSFRQEREEGNFEPFGLKVANSLIVDNFFEITTQMSQAEQEKLRLGPANVVLLSKGERPHMQADSPHCLARVKEVVRKRGDVQVVYRVNSGNNPLRQHLHDKATVYGVKLWSLTTLEREFGALKALEYYDLAEEIIKAKPSPLLDYTDDEVRDIRTVYNVNDSQARAVKSAVDNDAFTLVQGPPGTGKTKTICAIVGATLTNALNKPALSKNRPLVNGRPQPPAPSQKILVCAPSNAAVDELVMRFKDGLKLMDGATEKLNVVRLGRQDAVNAAVKDVTLEELVSARLNTNMPNSNGQDDIHAVMMEHKKTSEDFQTLRSEIENTRRQGKHVDLRLEEQLDSMRRKKQVLGAKIDEMREKNNSASRDADINRRRVQQEILDSAHVLCATLSGSGHEIFQSLNVEFETVIIDEAAQSIELSALIPLKYGCSKCILVGDPKQLPPTVLSRQAARYQYEQSLFARMEGNHRKDVHLLDVQYRMHPEISVFPSRTFYDSRLRDGGDMALQRARPWHRSNIFAPYRFFDVEGMSESAKTGRSIVNMNEVQVAMRMYERLIKDVPNYDFRGKVGIITPYKGQLKMLKQQFSMRFGEDIFSAIEFNTTDAFQGRESEIIIFSCVRADTKGIGFLQDIRRMNVGLTRAKSSLWVLGNSKALIQGEFWNALVVDARSRNLYTDGNILQMLNRPLLTQDMMKDDIEMQDIIADNGIRNGPRSIVTNDTERKSISGGESPALTTSRVDNASARAASGPSERGSRPAIPSRSSSVASIPKIPSKIDVSSRSSPIEPPKHPEGSNDATVRAGLHKNRDSPQCIAPNPRAPSGGKFGLDSKAACAICGSTEHRTSNCDNDKARGHQHGSCQRCGASDHRRELCQTPRCLFCGEVGHNEAGCKIPSNKRLNEQEKAHVQRQESDFQRQRDKYKAKQMDRQRERTGPTIPNVKSTAQNSATHDGKRKRDSITPQDAPVKSVKVSTDPAPVPMRPPAQTAPDTRPGQPPLVRKKKAKEGDLFAKKR